MKPYRFDMILYLYLVYIGYRASSVQVIHALMENLLRVPCSPLRLKSPQRLAAGSRLQRISSMLRLRRPLLQQV